MIDFLITCGVEPHNYIHSKKKVELINAIWLHFVFFEVHAELHQFKKGFRETLEMEMLISQHPNEIRALLVPSDFKMTAGRLLDLFTINYSDSERKRCLEEAVIAYWKRYIIGLETEGTNNYYIYNCIKYSIT